MGTSGEFEFRPLSNTTEIAKSEILSFDSANADPLGPLSPLLGSWEGTGFNTIWRPLFDPDQPDQKHFLELNLTVESIAFSKINGPIPNRGLLQQDLLMAGLHYLQQVNDNHGNGLHLEPGVWLTVPATTEPSVPLSVVRMGSIPHGTTILAQGLVTSESRAPQFAVADITPFVIGDPTQKLVFPETNLSIPTEFRSEPSLIAGVTQAMVDDPNSVLQAALAGQDVVSTTNLILTTGPTPIIGGGTANTAFLQGDAAGPNADAVSMEAIFWIEQVRQSDGSIVLQLQYTQTVLLDFNGLSWPHVSVATLRQVAPAA
ncbi:MULTISPECIES: heme-binding protein [unclassified Sphingomonas]|uniref:heme-binding protein n=1 Tax=unclassified Sphingomonas TaxID=196159 RepID=UPI00286CB515|nr:MULTISPECIES: heme-binding protein [unclassified Sphingomonas]